MRIQDERILSITDTNACHLPSGCTHTRLLLQLVAEKTRPTTLSLHVPTGYEEQVVGSETAPPALMRHLSVDLRGLSRLGMELGIPSSYAASVQHLRTTELHVESDGH